MNFIHSREFLNEGDIVMLNCDTQCNFMLTDDLNFSSYKSGGHFNYYGGHFKMFPARIAVPHSGYWNITIDLGGGSANIRYDLQVIKRSS
ncbi:MAG: DUF1883 domain-containing protein [Thermodesulfobacteriota bacterium]